MKVYCDDACEESMQICHNRFLVIDQAFLVELLCLCDRKLYNGIVALLSLGVCFYVCVCSYSCTC